VGSEGTLAIITQVILRLVPRPPVQITLRATFTDVEAAVRAVTELIRRRVVPATLELIDRESLAAVSRYLGTGLAPPGTGAVLLIEVDGLASGVREEADRVVEACRVAGTTELLRADEAAARDDLWRIRRELSHSLRTVAGLKINHDVVVPRGRVPDLFTVVGDLKREHHLRIACFGHAGDGNIHVNIMVRREDAGELERARRAERQLFERVVALEGSISGEHGIGFAKAKYLGIELSEVEIALMKRIKRAFDPNGILNPGKIFP
jgi:glycolate oxidase